MTATPLNKVKRKAVNVSSEISYRIAGAISDGTLKPGHRFPAEREWAVELGVSRATLRDAVKVLAGQGLLEVRRNKGIFVADPTSADAVIEKVAEALILQKGPLADLFEVRTILEAHSARWAAERGSREAILKLQSTYRTLLGKLESRRLSIEEANHYDRQLHKLIAEASGNQVLVNVVENLRKMQEKSRSLDSVLTERRIEINVDDMGKILHAIETSDGEAAYLAMEDHLVRGEAENRALNFKSQDFGRSPEQAR